MGGVGSGGSRMGGIGSDPNYNPHGGYGQTDFDVGALGTSVMSGLGSAFGALSTVAGSVTAAVQDENAQRQLAATAGSFWGGLSAGATNFVNTVTQPDDPGGDGLADLQRQFHSQRSARPDSKYGGFGSDSMMGGNNHRGGGTAAMPSQTPTMPPSAMPASSVPVGEAPPGPGEDPNGIERLSGESDEQYVMRQTRLRDEAKARMAAKFGGGGMGGVGSSGGMGGMGGGGAPASGGLRAPSSGGFGGIKAQNSASAPSSGNLNGTPNRTQKAPTSGGLKVTSGDDFFANFGT